MKELSAREATANALVEFMPVAQAERLGAVLTQADVETLRDLVRAATPANTLRAVASDLAYLEAWTRAATGEALAFPPDEALALKFIAQHLFRPGQRASGQGMPRDIENELRDLGILRGALPHAPTTVARRLASWRRIAQVRGYEDALSSSMLRRAFAAARKASTRTREPKSKIAVTRSVLDKLVGTETTPGFLTLRELRDRTLLLVAFATGGRRRSEVGGLLIENVFPIDLGASTGIRLGRTKTTTAQDGEHLVVAGRAHNYLQTWLAALAKRKPPIVEGAMFRSVDKWGNVGGEGITGKTVNDVLKRRAAAAGLDADELSAHGLRSGYLTEASAQGVPLEQAMRHSKHQALASAARYYRDREQAAGNAAKLGG